MPTIPTIKTKSKRVKSAKLSPKKLEAFTRATDKGIFRLRERIKQATYDRATQRIMNVGIKESRRIYATKTEGRSNYLVKNKARGSHEARADAWDRTENLAEVMRAQTRSSKRTRAHRAENWAKANKVTSTLEPLIHLMSKENIDAMAALNPTKTRHDVVNMILREFNRSIKLWDNNKEFIRDMRELSANKPRFRDLFKDPHQAANFLRIHKRMYLISKATYEGSFKKRIWAMFTKAGWQDLLNRTDSFLIDSDYYGEMWQDVNSALGETASLKAKKELFDKYYDIAKSGKSYKQEAGEPYTQSGILAWEYNTRRAAVLNKNEKTSGDNIERDIVRHLYRVHLKKYEPTEPKKKGKSRKLT